MRISKQNHLKRLLQTQDVLIAGLAYSASQLLLWWFGYADLRGILYHLQLLPFVFLFGAAAAIGHVPALYRQSVFSTIIFAGRFATITVIGMLAVAYFAKFNEVSRSELMLAYRTRVFLFDKYTFKVSTPWV